LWDRAATVSTSRLSWVEGRAALARARRERRLGPSAFERARRRLEELLVESDFVEPSPALVAVAAELSEAYALRAYDAVHFASAVSLGESDLIVATWDGDLRRAAQQAGFAVAPAELVQGS
jgi:predicted nucleic acid-binding protein